MTTSKNQISTAEKIGQIINLFIIAAGFVAVVYGLALYIVKYL
jgi:hypothetical protein